jgi:hypothetical protein
MQGKTAWSILVPNTSEIFQESYLFLIGWPNYRQKNLLELCKSLETNLSSNIEILIIFVSQFRFVIIGVRTELKINQINIDIKKIDSRLLPIKKYN